MVADEDEATGVAVGEVAQHLEGGWFGRLAGFVHDHGGEGEAAQFRGVGGGEGADEIWAWSWIGTPGADEAHPGFEPSRVVESSDSRVSRTFRRSGRMWARTSDSVAARAVPTRMR